MAPVCRGLVVMGCYVYWCLVSIMGTSGYWLNCASCLCVLLLRVRVRVVLVFLVVVVVVVFLFCECVG